MSLSLIAFQPSIEEPSNIRPSVSSSSPISPATIVRCCHLPFGSVKRRSTHSISSSLILFRMSPAVAAIVSSLACYVPTVQPNGIASDRVFVAFAGADAERGLDGDDEDLAVADPPGLRRGSDRLHHARREIVFDDDLQLHLGQEIDDIFGAAVQLGVAL